MKTRDRILLCTLQLFNEQGEPNVTTLDIANELDISPGNLYYHFRGKEVLVDSLLASFLEQTGELVTLQTDPHELSPEDYWLFMHLLFEAIIRYRFLFLDLPNLMGRYPQVQRAMHHWLEALRASLRDMLLALQDEQRLACNAQELEALLDGLCQTFLFWIDYQRVRQLDEADPSAAVRQVLGMMLPYLDEPTRNWMKGLMQRYR